MGIFHSSPLALSNNSTILLFYKIYNQYVDQP